MIDGPAGQDMNRPRSARFLLAMDKRASVFLHSCNIVCLDIVYFQDACGNSVPTFHLLACFWLNNKPTTRTKPSKQTTKKTK